jgi:hypothetical protein
LIKFCFCLPQGPAGLSVSTSLRESRSIQILLRTARLVPAKSLAGEKCELAQADNLIDGYSQLQLQTEFLALLGD